MNVDITPLPGIGVCKDFPLAGVRRRVGVIDHRDGTIDLVVTRIDDPDACVLLPLSSEEAGVLANLLGAPQLLEQLREQTQDPAGVSTRQITIRRGTPYDGKTLGETAMRTRTKTSVVAVVRAGQTIASPAPGFAFAAGDVLVVVGTANGLAAATKILAEG